MMAKLDDFQRSCLDAHNKLRTERGVPKLRWCDDVATSSLNWAQNLSEKGYLQHSDNPVLGENISVTTGDLSGDAVVHSWLEEEAKYNYELERWQRGTSRFTQMLWRSSTEFGVAKVPLKGKDGFAIVANYRPRGNGNKPGEYKKNVPSPAGKVNGWTGQASIRAKDEENVSASLDNWEASGGLDNQIASDQPDNEIGIALDQVDNEIASDQPDTETASDQPDNEIASDQPDNEIASGQLDNWEASGRLEKQDSSDQPGNEDSWDQLDTEDSSDRLDIEITSDQPGKEIAPDRENGEDSSDRLDNGDAALDQFDNDDLADVPNGIDPQPTDVQDC